MRDEFASAWGGGGWCYILNFYGGGGELRKKSLKSTKESLLTAEFCNEIPVAAPIVPRNAGNCC